MMDERDFRVLELNGGRVLRERPFLENPIRLQIPIIEHGYCDAQIDDYGLV